MIHSFEQRLSRLAIVVFCEPGPGTAEIIRHLQRSRATVRSNWPLREGMAADADLVICDYAAGLAKRLPCPPEHIMTLPNCRVYAPTPCSTALQAPRPLILR